MIWYTMKSKIVSQAKRVKGPILTWSKSQSIYDWFRSDLEQQSMSYNSSHFYFNGLSCNKNNNEWIKERRDGWNKEKTYIILRIKEGYGSMKRVIIEEKMKRAIMGINRNISSKSLVFSSSQRITFLTHGILRHPLWHF